MSYRLYEQALNIFESEDCKPGDIIQPFIFKVIRSGICPTLTTRPEGFKTSIIVVVE